MATRFWYDMAIALLRAGRDVKRDPWNGNAQHLDRLRPGQSQVKQVTDGIAATWAPSQGDLNARDWHVRTSGDL